MPARRDGRPARPWLTVVLDDHSRVVAGYTVFLGAPSALNFSLALRQAIAGARWSCSLRVGDHRAAPAAARVPGSRPARDVGTDELDPARHRSRGVDQRYVPPAEHSETGLAPQQAWIGDGWLPRTAQTLEELDLLLVMVATPRVVHRDGIRFQGLRDLDPTLAAYVGEAVTSAMTRATSPRSGCSTTTGSCAAPSALSTLVRGSPSKTSGRACRSPSRAGCGRGTAARGCARVKGHHPLCSTARCAGAIARDGPKRMRCGADRRVARGEVDPVGATAALPRWGGEASSARTSQPPHPSPVPAALLATAASAAIRKTCVDLRRPAGICGRMPKCAATARVAGSARLRSRGGWSCSRTACRQQGQLT